MINYVGSRPWMCLSIATGAIALYVMFIPLGSEAQDGDETDERLRYPAMLVMRKATCDEHPGFAEPSKDTYLAWRSAYEPALTELEKRPEHAQTVEVMKTHRRAQVAAGQVSADDRLLCDSLLHELRLNVAANDPDLAAPEQTWRLYLQALRTGDRLAAQKCLTGPALVQWLAIFGRLSNSELKQLADSVTFFQVTRRRDRDLDAEFALENHPPTAIHFHLVNGNWRISEM